MLYPGIPTNDLKSLSKVPYSQPVRSYLFEYSVHEPQPK